MPTFGLGFVLGTVVVGTPKTSRDRMTGDHEASGPGAGGKPAVVHRGPDGPLHAPLIQRPDLTTGGVDCPKDQANLPGLELCVTVRTVRPVGQCGDPEPVRKSRVAGAFVPDRLVMPAPRVTDAHRGPSVYVTSRFSWSARASTADAIRQFDVHALRRGDHINFPPARSISLPVPGPLIVAVSLRGSTWTRSHGLDIVVTVHGGQLPRAPVGVGLDHSQMSPVVAMLSGASLVGGVFLEFLGAAALVELEPQPIG